MGTVEMICTRLHKFAFLMVGVFVTTSVFGHHVFSTEYDADKPVRIKGVVTRVDWVNPHAWIYVDVKDAAGKIVTWSLEFGSPNALLRRGVRKTDLPIGTEVNVFGYLSKSKDAVLNATAVKLPDGRDFYAGSENTGAPPTPSEPGGAVVRPN